MKAANNRRFSSTLTRREILRRGMAGISLAGLSGTVLAPSLIGQAAHAAAAAQANEKILVILELSGGNDGLNTVVPMETMLTTGIARTLVWPRVSFGYWMITSGSTAAWQVLSVCIKMVPWLSFTDAAMKTPHTRTSPRWRIGTRPPQTAEMNMDGLAAWLGK